MALLMNYVYKLNFVNDRVLYDTLFKNKFPDIQHSISQSVVVENAYLMISTIEGTKESITFTLTVYENQDKEYIIETKQYTFTPSVAEGSENYHKQGYEYLKSLPEYVGAIDV